MKYICCGLIISRKSETCLKKSDEHFVNQTGICFLIHTIYRTECGQRIANMVLNAYSDFFILSTEPPKAADATVSKKKPTSSLHWPSMTLNVTFIPSLTCGISDVSPLLATVFDITTIVTFNFIIS